MPDDAARDGESVTCGPDRTSCEGGTCLDGRCQPVVLVEHGFPPLALGGDRLAYFDQGKAPPGHVELRTVPSSGGDSTFIAVVGFPRGVTADDTHVYWLDENPEGVFRAPIVGGAVVRLTGAPIYVPEYTDHDPLVVAGDALVFAGGAGVYRIPKAGGSPERVGEPSPQSFVVAGNQIFSASHITRTIEVISLDGSLTRVLASKEEGAKNVQLGDGYVFWTSIFRKNPSDQEPDWAIRRMPVSGGVPITIATSKTIYAFAADGRDLCWFDGNLLHRASVQGSEEKTDVIEQWTDPVFDARRMYFGGTHGRIFKRVR